MGIYRIAQICLKGHVINDSADVYPQRNEKFCSKCGQATIMNCPKCDTPIRGDYYVEGVLGLGEQIKAPSFCYNCGSPYPWTLTTLDEINEIIDMADELDEVDRTILHEKFPQVMIDSPGTTAAALRISKVLKAAGNATVLALKSAVVSKLADSVLAIIGWK